MSKSATHPISVKIIEATETDLRTYAIGVRNNRIKATDFCEYLQQKHKLTAHEVVADISGQVFSGIDLEGIDLGNVIATRRKVGGKHQESGTQFQQCNFKNAKLRSKSSLEGLEFNECSSMDGMILEGDIRDVKFDINTNITGIDLTRAHNIDKCLIDKECTVSRVKLDFHDREAFQAFIDQKREKGKKDSLSETQINPNSIPPAPTIERKEEATPNPGIQVGVVQAAKGLLNLATATIGAFASVASTVLSSATNFVTGSITIGADKPPTREELHNRSIKLIRDSNPVFPSKENGHEITEQDVTDWIERNQKNNEENLSTEPLSLEEYVKTTYDDIGDKKLYMTSLNFEGSDFSRLKFGDINISKCNFSRTIFKDADLTQVSARDCNFSSATFMDTDLTQVSAKDCNFSSAIFKDCKIHGADLTRSVFNSTEIQSSDFNNSTLVDVDFSSAKIKESVLDYTNMQSAIMNGTEVTSTTFNGTDMSNLVGEKAILLYVECNEANLSGASFAKSQITNMKINNTNAYNLDLDAAELTHVQFNQVTAQGISLIGAIAQNVSIIRSDISYGKATGATLASVTIQDSHAIKLYAPSLKTVPLTTSEADKLNPNRPPKDHKLAELQDKKIYKGLSVVNSDFQGADLSGSLFNHSKLSHVNLSHATMQNIAVKASLITHSNLHGADLSGKNAESTQYHYSDIQESNLTDANLENSKMLGGSFSNNDISGTDMSNSQIGSRDAKVNLTGIHGDISTNFAGVTIDTTKPDATVTIETFHGGNDKIPVSDLAQKSARNISLMTNSMTNTANSVASEGSLLLSGISKVVTSIAHNMKQYKKSRLGMAIGITTGVIIGGLVIGYLATTMGLGAIPLAIGGAIAVGAGAVGGGVMGNIIQNTNTGRGVLAMISGALGAIVMGPIGLVATPVLMTYNLITGKKTSPISSAVGSMLDTFIAKPMATIARFVAGVVPDPKEQKDAQRFSQERERRKKVVEQEKKKLETAQPKDIHSQSMDNTQLTIVNKHNALTKDEPKKTTWKDKVRNIPTNVKKKFTDMVSNKSNPVGREKS